MRSRLMAAAVLALAIGMPPALFAAGQPAAPAGACTVQSADFHGWEAEQISNQWTTLTIVPQLGGRLMQVEFGGHSYLL